MNALRPTPISSQHSVRGAVTAGLGITMLAAGLWRVDGVLATLGLAICVLLAGGWLIGRLNLTNLRVTLAAPSGVPAGVVFPAVLTLRNQRWLWDAIGIRLELELPGAARAGGEAKWLPSGSAADLDLRLAVPRRAHVLRHPVRLASTFPLGMFEHRRTLLAEHEMLVFPRPINPVGLRAMGVVMDATPDAGTAAGEAMGELRGLRPWRPGDAMRRIDWPATVRSWSHGAGLVVREADPPGFHPRRCLLLFHSFGADGSLIRPERFEHALSLAAGVIRQFHHLGIPVRLVADFDSWAEHPATSRSQLATCQEVLARAVRARGTEAHDLQAAAARVRDDEVLVALSDMPVTAWRDTLPKLRLPALTPELRSLKSSGHARSRR